MFDTLADAAKSLPVGSRQPFQAMLFDDSDDVFKPFWFDIVRNDEGALIVTRQWQPGIRRDLTQYRSHSNSSK